MAKGEVLALMRSLLRAGRQFPSYNMRHYVLRRTVEGFRENRRLAGEVEVQSALEEGRKQLDVVKRQGVVYKLYAPSLPSIMDIK